MKISKDLRPALYWLCSAGVFSIAALFGMAVGAKREAPLLIPVGELGGASLTATGLFVHNASLALTAVAGVFTFGIYTTFQLVLNGFALGGFVVDGAGSFGLLRTLLVLTPHAMFEFPAIWLAGAIGFRWTHVVWVVANGDGPAEGLPTVVRRSLGAFALLLVLIAVAAVIEAHVSAPLASALAR